MSADAVIRQAAGGTTPAAEPSAARRLRFREAVSRLSTKAQSTDLVRSLVLPGAIGVIVGFSFMLFGWLGAARTVREIEQIPYLISGGLMGLALVFLGGLLLASSFWMVLIKKLQEDSETRLREHSQALEERFAELVTSLHPSQENGHAPTARKRTSRTTKTRTSKS